MANYIIKKTTVKIKIKKFKKGEGYTLNPHIKNNKMISIERLTIENQKCIDILLNKKIAQNFRKIMALYLSIIENDDATSGDVEIALNEIEHFKNIIAYKYEQHISKELMLKYLKRIALFEKNLRDKLNILMIQEKIYLNNELNNSKGR